MLKLEKGTLFLSVINHYFLRLIAKLFGQLLFRRPQDNCRIYFTINGKEVNPHILEALTSMFYTSLLLQYKVSLLVMRSSNQNIIVRSPGALVTIP